MKNSDRPTQQGVRVKLSGVVSVPHHNSADLEKWKEIFISSFRETRFQNVLKRAKLLPLASWFWHESGDTYISDLAVVIIGATSNDYRQILVKQNQLANTVRELDPHAELLLLIAPDTTYVFGTVLETGSDFCTHIILSEKKQESRRGYCSPWRKEVAINNSPDPRVLATGERFAIASYKGRSVIQPTLKEY